MANIVISKKNNQIVVTLKFNDTILFTYYCNSNKEAAEFIELATNK
jgi:hypothetical protein